MNAQQLITQHLDIWTAAHKTRSSAGRGSSNKLDLVGIKKLRELILELAVRGKLVLQDSNDEPASELLKKIAAEKSRLIKEGKVKKDKPILEIEDDEITFELPNGWKWSRLSDISIINPRNNAENELKVSFVPMTLIDTKFDGGHDQEVRLWKEIKQGFTHFAEGDIGVAKITPCFENSKACVFKNLVNGIGAGTTELHIVRPINNTLNPRYVLACLKSPSFLLVGETKMTGTAGQKRLPKDFLESYPFALPPLAEQHRIVAKVDELMAFCDQLEQTQSDNIAAHAQLIEALLATLTASTNHNELQTNWQRIAKHFDTLFTTEHSIDQLKQTILQLAVMGKLVPQNPNDEPASELLKKISTEKARLIKEGKIKKEKPLPQITDEEKSFELPGGWEWVRFSSVANSRLGKMLDKAKNTGNMKPYLRNTNVQWGVIELDDVKMMKLEDSELSEFKLEYGDLLICEGGYPGRCAIWKDKNIEMYFQKALHRARAFPGVASEFLQVCLFNDLNTGGLNQYISGATIQHFTGDKLDRYVIPMAPSNEQHRIVTKVDELMALCDTLKINLQNSQTTQLALADALVEQAIN